MSQPQSAEGRAGVGGTGTVHPPPPSMEDGTQPIACHVSLDTAPGTASLLLSWLSVLLPTCSRALVGVNPRDAMLGKGHGSHLNDDAAPAFLPQPAVQEQ